MYTMYPYTHTQPPVQLSAVLKSKANSEYIGDDSMQKAAWLYTGLQQKDERWSCFYVGRHEWAGHVFDWAEAVTERARQERRREESPRGWEMEHTSECICGICAWMEKDMWEAEDMWERSASRNVFFNGLYEHQKDQLFKDLWECKEFWEAICWKSLPI